MSISTTMLPAAATRTPRSRPIPWPLDLLRVSFGVIWAIDATLKWMPGFRASYLDSVQSAGQGQPGWLHPWFHFWYHVQSGQPTAWAYLIAIIETCLALALIAGFARKLTYFAGIAFSLMIWSVAEGFGGPYHSGSTDVGTAIVYAMTFAFLLAISACFGPSRYSVDYYLEARWPWWSKLAEFAHRP